MKPLEVLCPVCDGAIKWHRNGSLCNLPIKMLMGVVCSSDHTFCMFCKGTGRVDVDYVENV